MLRTLLAATIISGVIASTLDAQSSTYVPSTDPPNGRQILAVYLGAESCGPCHNAAVKEAVVGMKSLVAANAKRSGASFAAIGVANDWDQSQAARFLATNGPFDQVALGGNFTNLAIEQFVWRDAEGTASMPQILIIERTVKQDARIVFSEQRVLRRILGSEEIPAWFKQGAPITAVAAKP